MKKSASLQISAQSPLFQLEETTAQIELFPTVWLAVEELISADPATRLQALEQLVGLDVPRHSPLVSHTLVSLLSEADLALRTRLVEVLSAVLTSDLTGRAAPEAVRQIVKQSLSQMRTRQVYALLQVLVVSPGSGPQVARLLNASPYAGRHLVDILSDRKAPLALREQAVQMIAQVGYLDAIPDLERIANRLEARRNGQTAMPFSPPAAANEAELLPVIMAALISLRSP